MFHWDKSGDLTFEDVTMLLWEYRTHATLNTTDDASTAFIKVCRKLKAIQGRVGEVFMSAQDAFRRGEMHFPHVPGSPRSMPAYCVLLRQ